MRVNPEEERHEVHGLRMRQQDALSKVQGREVLQMQEEQGRRPEATRADWAFLAAALIALALVALDLLQAAQGR